MSALAAPAGSKGFFLGNGNICQGSMDGLVVSGHNLIKMGLKKLEIYFFFLMSLFVFKRCCSHFWAGENRREDLGVFQPRPGLCPVPVLTKTRSRHSLDARVWSGLNATSLPGLNATWTSEKLGGEGTRAHAEHQTSAPCKDAAAFTGVLAGLQPAFTPQFRVWPCLLWGKLLVPPSPPPPALRGATLPVFLSQALDAFCADAKLLLQDPLIHPHGGLTPRLGFFSWLLSVLAGLVWAGPLHGVLL